ncbi:hypothetical protein ES703_120783 [subsurface metagenome]
MNRKKELFAPCGLFCGVCPWYRAQRDETLAKKLAARLQLPVEAARCPGCRAVKGLAPVMGGQVCETYDCAARKGVDFCYQCDDFPCPNLAPCADRAAEIAHNTKIYNLLLIQKKGTKALAREASTLRRRYFEGKKPRPGGEPQL